MTDFSESAQQALRQFVTFLKASKEAVQVTLLHTYVLPTTNTRNVVELNDEYKQASLAGLTLALKNAELADGNGQFVFETKSSLGSLENVVSQLLHTQAFDYIAMAIDKNHNNGFSKLLANISCPLLLIPPPKNKR